MSSYTFNSLDVLNNDYFRRVLHTGDHQQYVAMALKPKENIGMEKHPDNTQSVEIIDGKGEAIINGEKIRLVPGIRIVVEPGTNHDFRASTNSWLRLLTIYSPPLHPEGEINKSKPLVDTD